MKSVVLYCSRQALIYVPKVTSANEILGRTHTPNCKVLYCLDQGSSVTKRKRHENKKGKKTKQKAETMDASSIFLGALIQVGTFFAYAFSKQSEDWCGPARVCSSPV